MENLNKRLKESLTRINIIYIPGCIEWYERNIENEWALAWHQLGECFKNGSDGLKKIKLMWWEKTTSELIEKYKKKINE